MKELSREEKLEREIFEKEKFYDDRKWLRTKQTFFVLSGIIYVMAFMGGAMRGSLQEYFYWLFIAPVAAGIVMFVSCLVLLYIVSGSLNDSNNISRLKGKLDEIKCSKYSDDKD